MFNFGRTLPVESSGPISLSALCAGQEGWSALRKSLIGLFATALVGCASSGRIGQLPEVPEGTPSSQLVLIRSSNIIGAMNSYYVALDGRDVFSIGSGENINFSVPLGEHTVSVKCFGGWSPTWKEDGMKFVAQRDRASYFEISPTMSCAKIVEIESEEAKKLVSVSKFVSPSTISNK
ncbi:hypothetical protein RA280_40230 [Cupriavidus sp. CV2]|uniref:hypothetical protein n=1 Tax=Cupriavidus ulmosensis TaxID=3065913 RepID=UPI00296AEDF0|nr:hypothetical protein [Cupriavidus sp. CV2]MDW3687852.1 hypothetical protein [Cupriavidus sp. CV2]